MSEEPCPVCNGSRKQKCVCGGTGLLRDAYAKTAELFLRERNEHEATKDALKQLQQAVLAFVFNPQFRQCDRNGYFRRFWEEKLQVKVAVVEQDDRPAVIIRGRSIMS
jgi:hypothetical protein